MLDKLKIIFNMTRTENNALSYESTTSYILDLFALGGSSRMMDINMLARLISKALAEDFNLALRVIFYISDIRGGLGERDFFKISLGVIARFYPDKFKKIIHLIPEYGRWDYLYMFVGTKFQNNVFDVIRDEHNRCMSEEKTSLMYKWLKSVNASNPETNALGNLTAKELSLSTEEYRKLLSQKRKELKIVEKAMSSNLWNTIKYDEVPSKASILYRNAFKRHDEKRYTDYLSQVEAGTSKINTKTLYPYEIISRYLFNYEVDETLEQAWKNLPNYLEGKNENILSVIDVSGSMYAQVSPNSKLNAIAVAIGLGLYFAERINGRYKNHFITFSGHPRLTKIEGDTLSQKIYNITKANWQMNTDIEKVFDLILDTAIKYNLDQNELPDKILIVSDMQFDCVSGGDTPYNTFKAKYLEHGYKLPQVVFWQVNARATQVPVTFDENGTALLSGYSPVTLKYIFEGIITNPYELMLKVVKQPRYDLVVDTINS